MDPFPLDFLFPRRCLGCGKVGFYFCQDCQESLKPVIHQICPVCERPSIGGATHPGCQTKFSLDGLTSIFAYENLARKAIKTLKYQFVSDLAESLVEVSITNFEFSLEGILIPVPLFSKRTRWRGFNQAEVLGKILARKLRLGFNPQVLRRSRPTLPQTELSGEVRRQNVAQAFKIIDKRAIKGKSLVLFDDVWTTGATLKSSGLALKGAGAEKVWGLTLAR